jgi:hypothetical protein
LNNEKNYILILPCANKKNETDATYNGKEVYFCANPQLSKKSNSYHPDEIETNTNKSWRELVDNKKLLKMIQAYELYIAKLDGIGVYENLYNLFREKFFVFSAGWGIVRAKRELPNYNITFGLPDYAKITKKTKDLNYWNDLTTTNIPDNIPIVIAAGDKYIEPFIDLTKEMKNEKIIIYNTNDVNEKNGYEYVKWNYPIPNMNWYYYLTRLFKQHKDAIHDLDLLLKYAGGEKR